MEKIGNSISDRLEINYFLPKKNSNISSAFRHVKRGRGVHYGNVVV